ncbi:hypothetical protein CgunFtcFv8_017728 [Champsocephalus gunnari]|uniref:Uncharacterized protein n=1 Tax=Champsocephalus gunnari TaxID=52237 RepID=A0AAN8DVW1_CHAGU|nr:hypothetical protein CgunFtcFv8_017728 [Champsocephalus gunnari]
MHLHTIVSPWSLVLDPTLTLSQCRRTEADNKFHKRLRVKGCLHPLPPSQNPPRSKGKKTSIWKIITVPLILIQ